MRKGYSESKKSKKLFCLIVIMLVIVVVIGIIITLLFSLKNNYTKDNINNSDSDDNKEISSLYDLDKVIENMSLEDKIGQMIMISFRKDTNDNRIVSIEDIQLKVLTDINPGGVVLFSENILDVNQVQKYIADVNQNSKIPPFISIDQEGGRVQRITNTEGIGATKIPNMLQLGKMNDTELTYNIGKLIGSELRVFGFNMDFAPVADIYSNPNNEVIGNRAFGKDANTVSKMVNLLAEGLKSENIIPVFKHFPGHGDTDEDTHKGKVILDKSLEELENLELIPFKRAIEEEADCIMISHIILPQIDSSRFTIFSII